MDDTQKDGSDSDWDSTLDFTSPRQVGVGQLPPRIDLEVEEESALSEESDVDEIPSIHVDKPVIRNALKPNENKRSTTPSPNRNQKENNIALAQKQQNVQKTHNVQERREPAGFTHKQDNTPPPYNFQEAMNGKSTPEPATRGPPGKDRKGTMYDAAPSPTPRGISSNRGSIRSVGSWDESDADERTLRELGNKYRQEKQKEELKIKEAEEQKSMLEEPPQTARSETTWRSKFGKKTKNAQNNQTSQASKAPGRSQAQLQTQPLTARSQSREVITMATANVPPRIDVTAQPPVELFDVRYESKSPSNLQLQHSPVPRSAFENEEMEQFDEPKQLFVKDDDLGRYVYYFGHGNLRYYEVNEGFDEAYLPSVADKVDKLAQRIWQELFAILRIILSFFIWFFVELFRFLARHIFQPLILGIFLTLGDFVIKPLLSAIFNGFMQPFSIFWWNVFTGMRHMFRPFGDILARVLEQFAMLFRSIRLFEINWIAARQEPQQGHVLHNV